MKQKKINTIKLQNQTKIYNKTNEWKTEAQILL